jgi:hypothetical protein
MTNSVIWTIMTRNLEAAIFPHSSLSKVNLKKVLSVFDRVILFQPWFMEKAPSMAEDSPDMVKILNPPERLKPKENFKSLLAEYRQWIKVNDDRGFPAFLAYAQDRFQEELHIYELRGMIRNMGKTVEEDEITGVLKWHLILHLAEELEEEQQSTETLLSTMGGLDSPLKGVLEDEDVPGLLNDLPGLERETLFTDERLAQVLGAWVSLYGEKVPDRGPLVTIKPQVMHYLAETWEEFVIKGQGPGLPRFTFKSPDLSFLEGDEFLKRREKVLVGAGLRQAVADFCHDPGMGFPRPESPADEAARATGGLEWTFVYLPPNGKGKFPRRWEFMNGLSGKIIGLVQDGARNER